jgi:hypothetical protein
MNDRYAIIENGIVQNVVVATQEIALSNGWIFCPNGGPGWIYENNKFVEPSEQNQKENEPAQLVTKEELMAKLEILKSQIQALE